MPPSTLRLTRGTWASRRVSAQSTAQVRACGMVLPTRKLQWFGQLSLTKTLIIIVKLFLCPSGQSAQTTILSDHLTSRTLKPSTSYYSPWIGYPAGNSPCCIINVCCPNYTFFHVKWVTSVLVLRCGLRVVQHVNKRNKNLRSLLNPKDSFFKTMVFFSCFLQTSFFTSWHQIFISIKLERRWDLSYMVNDWISVFSGKIKSLNTFTKQCK